MAIENGLDVVNAIQYAALCLVQSMARAFESTAITWTPSARSAAAIASAPLPQPKSMTRWPDSISTLNNNCRAPGSSCR